MLFALLCLVAGTARADLNEGNSAVIDVPSLGSATDTWTTSLWQQMTENVPTGVTEAEKGQYPNKTSNVWAASKTISSPAGYLKAAFVYQGGNNRIDILGADLLNGNGEVVSNDYHFGYSGNAKVNNVYTLQVPAEGSYTLRYWVTFCAESNTSNGNITLQHMNVLPISSAAELSNDKVYTVTPNSTVTENTGAWGISEDGTKLSVTMYTGGDNPADKKQQFAFLTVNGETYLYSYGAEKFVADDGTGQKLTAELDPECLVKIVASEVTDKVYYPLIVQVGGDYLCSTNQGHFSEYGGIVTNWNYTTAAGNAVAIVPVDGTVDLSAAVAKIEAYQAVAKKEELAAKIAEATTLAGKSYINSDALNAAIAAAESVYGSEDASYAQVVEQISALTAAITAAGYVSKVEEFSNNAIYTFVSNRNANAYMMYDGETDYVASHYMKNTLEVGADVVNCQWAVYKSEADNYYMYNLGAQKFMGTESAANTSIPFSATPQTTDLILKVSSVTTHPIMISSDGGTGVANHSNNKFDGKNQAGLINWYGGFNQTSDAGNVHKVAIVGALDEAVLATIADLVEAYEGRGFAVQALNECLAAFEANYYDAWASTAYKWRDQSGVNNYTINNENALTLEQYYNNAKAVVDNEESTVEELNEQTALLKEVETWLTINQPEDGKFYRLRCTASGSKYLQCTQNTNKNRFDMIGGEDGKTANATFCYINGGLVAYANPMYINHDSNTANYKMTVTNVTFSEANVKGQYFIQVGERYLYGDGNNSDSGTGTSNDRAGYRWWLEEVASLPVTISAAGYATFYAPVEVTLPDGITAHTVTANGEWAILSEAIKVVPANNGVILKADQGSYNLTVSATDAADLENALDGTVAKTLITKTEGDAYYVLAKKDENVGLYNPVNGENTATFYNAGFKAYWHIPAVAQSAGYRFGEGTTAIDNSQLTIDNLAIIYDLAGRRVEKMEKGIYIVNGKKVVIK